MTFPTVDLHGIYGITRYVLAPVLLGVIFFSVLFHLARGKKEPVIFFMLFAIGYMFIMANLGQLAHNSILRKQIDPLLFAGAALWLTELVSMGSGSGAKVDGMTDVNKNPIMGRILG